MLENNPMIMLITETWLDNKTCDEMLKIKGYSILRKDRPENRGGGVLVYFHEDLRVTQLYVDPFYDDSVWFKLEIEDAIILICCFYRRPGQKIDEDRILVDNFGAGYDIFANGGFTDIFLIGDGNVPNIDWSCLSSNYSVDHFGSFLVEFIRDNSLWQNVRENTRFRNNSASLLDIIVNHNPAMIKKLVILPPIAKSDHCILELSIVVGFEEINCNRELIDFKSGDYDIINRELNDLLIDFNFDSVGAFNLDYDKMIDNINKIISNRLEKKVSKKRKSDKPFWYNSEIKKFKSIRRKLFDIYKITNSPADFLKFKQVRNKVISLIRNSKVKYNLTVAKNSMKNINFLYKHIKKCNKALPRRIKYILHNELKYSSSKSIGDIFGEKFAPKIIEHKGCFVSDKPSFEAVEKFLTNADEISRIIASCKNSFSAGSDNIPYFFIKKCTLFFSSFITLVVNFSLINMTIPEGWKQAIIIPIYKKGNRDDKDNYRPISLTSCISKIAEKIILSRLNVEIINKNILSNSQHGFRKHLSCCSNLLNSIDQWTLGRDKGKGLSVIYLDFSKAFDSVDIDKLLQKMIEGQVDIILTSWISIFLHNRSLKVMIDGTLSEMFPILQGVPQGCILSAVLFNVYISDIDIDIGTNIISYADDIKLFNFITNDKDVDDLQKDLNKIVEWANNHNLILNPSKCTSLNIGLKRLDWLYFINGQSLKIVESQRDLGVWTDSKLSFSTHWNHIIKKMGSRMAILQRTFNVITAELFSILYKVYIQPLIDYCSPAIFLSYKRDSDNLNKAFRRFTKRIDGFYNLSYNKRIDKLKKFKILTPTQRLLRNDLIFTFNSLNHGNDDIFLRNYYNQTRGHEFKLRTEINKTNTRKLFIKNRIVQFWNNLPNSIVNSKNVCIFKKNLDIYLSTSNIFSNMV